MRRVAYPGCGLKIKGLPSSSGKRQLADTQAWLLARWARRLSRQEDVEVCHTSRGKLFRSVEMAVEWGHAHQELSAVSAISIDEVAWRRGSRFPTPVYRIDEACRRLLWAGEQRRVKRLLGFFLWFGAELRFICPHMWRTYLTAIANKAAGASHVLDRFHIMAKISKALDEVRAQESKVLAAKGNEPCGSEPRARSLLAPSRDSSTRPN